MSRLTELLSQVAKTDAALAEDLRREVTVLSSRRPFGLNFERHVPESVQLPSRRIRRGDKVVLRSGSGSDQATLIVVGFKGAGAGRKARLVRSVSSDKSETMTAPLSDLVVVAEFRDTIYPGLRSTGVVQRGGDKPHHAVINGENYHVLQALSFVCRGQVDCIYIDPPYNTGARDWKYNNDYVDNEDAYRHSKWLAFMERRLELAKGLLNPSDSVLIATVDEKEGHRLGLLLEQSFPEAAIQMVTSVISPQGSARPGGFSRVEEYVYFVRLGSATVGRTGDDMLIDVEKAVDAPVWFSLIRSGTGARRADSKNLFYPVYVDDASRIIADVGDPLELGVDRSTVPDRLALTTVWPIRRDGSEGRWQLSAQTLREHVADGFAKVGERNPSGNWSIMYVRSGDRNRVRTGDIVENGVDAWGNRLFSRVGGGSTSRIPKSVWNRLSHDAGKQGSMMLGRLTGGRKFPFPKSLYAVEDALRFFVGDKRDALVLDFFAGSGTTAHAVMRLNKQDGGRRRSILVTNNEVSADEAVGLRAGGHSPGDPGWESLGICEHITKPRIEAAITGQTPEGHPIRGKYRFVDEFPMAEGFAENAEFFDLTYEDPERVRYGLGFGAIASLLWMRAGSEGTRIDRVDGPFAVADRYAILFDLDAAASYVSAVRAKPELRIAYIVTDDETQFQVVAGQLPHSVEALRLYAAYLDNFRSQAGA